ncbi:uncharacterized protein LOC121239067 [Juglans microcarpa x Juglans regia]|uniref:uncharacterized protein LOC121239067 n=1 Tax=Juglans microcarpa x Juglans regia TaxID=2249226 RepID=UPI001B7E119A|nr:uncharacterized protein LOC121239067 [Juglans microcarpa x Juglans regia]
MQLELVPHSCEVHSEKPEDLSYPHKTNVVYDVNHTTDPAISNMEELKMNEDTDDGWQLLNKQEIEKPTEHQAISDSEKPIEKNSKPNDDVGGNQVKLTENEIIMGMPKPIEAKEYFKSPQESGGERSIVESGACRVNQNSDDPIASTAQQDLVIEEVTINSRPSLSPKSISIQTYGVNQTYDDHNASAEQQELVIQDVLINYSSSSPKSVSIEKIPIDQMIHLDILQSHLEDTAKTSTLDEQPPLNLAPENLESIQESGDEQSVLPRGAFGVNQNYDDPNASTEQQESSIEDVHINSSSLSPKSVLTGKTPMDQASSNSNPKIHGDILQSQLENTEKASTLDEQPPLKLAPENLKSIQENGDEQSVIASGASGIYHNSDDPNASVARTEWVIEEEPCNPPEKSTEETSTVDNLNEPKPDDKDGNENSQSYQAIKDESETWISHTVSTGLSKSIEDNNNILGTMEPEKFIAEASTIYKVNDPIVSEKGDNEKFKSVEKSEGEPQPFIKQETVLESPEPDEPTGSKLIEDFDANSRKSSEGEAICGPLKSLEEIEDSRTEEETEDSRKLHEHDTIIHLPKSGDTTCNSEESQKLTECEAVDPSKLAVEKENPDVPATIAEEDPSNPDLPIKSISES